MSGLFATSNNRSGQCTSDISQRARHRCTNCGRGWNTDGRCWGTDVNRCLPPSPLVFVRETWVIGILSNSVGEEDKSSQYSKAPSFSLFSDVEYMFLMTKIIKSNCGLQTLCGLWTLVPPLKITLDWTHSAIYSLSFGCEVEMGTKTKAKVCRPGNVDIAAITKNSISKRHLQSVCTYDTLSILWFQWAVWIKRAFCLLLEMDAVICKEQVRYSTWLSARLPLCNWRQEAIKYGKSCQLYVTKALPWRPFTF